MRYTGTVRSEKWNDEGIIDVCEDGLEPLSDFEHVDSCHCHWPAPGDGIACCGREAIGSYCETHTKRAFNSKYHHYGAGADLRRFNNKRSISETLTTTQDERDQ